MLCCVALICYVEGEHSERPHQPAHDDDSGFCRVDVIDAKIADDSLSSQQLVNKTEQENSSHHMKGLTMGIPVI